MMVSGRSVLCVSAAVSAVAVALAGGIGLRQATALTPADELASHRAVYELKLAQTRGNSPAMSARGRILYDFSGSACEGYALQFRQVSELDNGEGKVTLSDLRSTSWEDSAAKSYVFKSQNYVNETMIDSVDGKAERQNDKVVVALTKPVDKKFDLEATIVFPTEHVRRIIAAARDGKTLLELAVYDGSDNGEKVFDTLAVIGRALAPDEHRPEDATPGQRAFQALKRWPVTISYFDRASKDSKEKSGEQTPVYAITFELYENGVSRALMLDYGDFVLSGELTSFEMKDVKPCP